MNPLMYEGLLPDGLRATREAARRHAILAARATRITVPRPRVRALRPIPQA